MLIDIAKAGKPGVRDRDASAYGWHTTEYGDRTHPSRIRAARQQRDAVHRDRGAQHQPQHTRESDLDLSNGKRPLKRDRLLLRGRTGPGIDHHFQCHAVHRLERRGDGQADAQFQFNGTVIGGRAENQPRWKRGVETTEGYWATPSGASTSNAISRAMRRPASMR